MSPLTFLGALLIQVGLTLFQLAIQRRPGRPRPAAFDGPTAEQGRSIPIVFGQFAIAPNVVWWGDAEPDIDDDIPDYNANMLMTVCHGPLTEITDIQFGGKSIRMAPAHEDGAEGAEGTALILPSLQAGGGVVGDADTPLPFDIQGLRFFGGGTKEGGVVGALRVYPGGLNQAVDPLTVRSWSEIPGLEGLGLGTSRPGICYLAWGAVGTPFHWSQNIPTPKDVAILGRVIPTGLFDLALDADYTTASIGPEANIAEVAYAIITNTEYGLGKSNDALDLTSLVNGAKLFAGEGLGVSCEWLEGTPAEDMLDDLKRYGEFELFDSPLTGKITMVPVRATDTAGDPVTVATASDLSVTRPSWAGVANSVTVKYREFVQSGSTPVVGELLTPRIIFDPGPSLGEFRPRWLKLNGINVTDVVIHNVTQASVLVEGTDYTVDLTLGWVTIYPNEGVDSEDRITADYTPVQGLYQFREAVTPPAQDLGAIQTDGLTPITEDYRFLSNALTAGLQANKRLAQVSHALATATWTEDRSAYATLPGSVRPITWAPFGMDEARFRVAEVDYGELHQGRIQITAVEDVFGLSVDPGSGAGSGHGTDGTLLVAPPIAIGYVTDSAIRIGLFPADGSFPIQLQRATDAEGSDGADIANPLAYDPDEPWYDDPQDVGDTFWYRARLLSIAGYTDGPWTPWIEMTAADGTPGDPECDDLTWAVVKDAVAGTVTLAMTDPQGRLQRVRFKHRVGLVSETSFVVDSVAPYTETVVQDGANPSTITWEVQYLSCDGLVTVSDTVVFDPADLIPPTDPPTLDSVTYPLVFHASTSALWGRRGVLALAEEIAPLARKRVTLGEGFAQAHVNVYASTASDGTVLYFAFSVDEGETWTALDGVDGPKVAIDATSAGDTPRPLVGSSVTIAEAAQRECIVSAFLVGGDGTGYVILNQIEVLVTAVATVPPVDGGDPTGPPDPPENPGDPVPPLEDPDPSVCDPSDEVEGNPWSWEIFDGCRITGSAPPTAVGDARGVISGSADYSRTSRQTFGGGVSIVSNDLNGRDTMEFINGGSGESWRLEGTDGTIGHAASWGDDGNAVSPPTNAEAWFVVKAMGAGGLVFIMQGLHNGTKIFPTSIESDFGSSIEHTIPLSDIDLSDDYHLVRIQAGSRFKVWVDGVLVYDAANTVAFVTSSFAFGVTNGWMHSYGGNTPYASMRIAELILYQIALTDDQADGLTGAIGARWGLSFGGATALDLLFDDSFED